MDDDGIIRRKIASPVPHLALVAAAGEITSGAASRGKAPPHDIPAEMAVLGGVLLDNAALGECDSIVTPEDFYHPAHGVIFQAMLTVASRSQPIDIYTLAAELRSVERLNTCGGAQYLGELTEAMPTSAWIESHAVIVRDLARRRSMIEAGQEIVARGFDTRGTTDAFCDLAVSRVMAVADKRSNVEAAPLSAAIIESFHAIEVAAESGRGITGLATPFTDLNNLTGGMHKGQLIVIGARPAQGKTSLLAALVEHASRTAPAMFFSLEMPRVELSNRLLCADARVDQSRIRTGLFTQDDVTALTAAANRLHNLPIFINDSGDTTLPEVRAQSRRMKRERGLSMVGIDYLQLMKSHHGDRDIGREREIADISRGLKALAKELEVPVVALSQLNRECEKRPGKKKRPMLSDIRDSGSVEQDADVVMFIYRDEVYNEDTEDKGIAELIVAKQRNGPTDTVRLRFVKELTKFENLSRGDGVGYGDASVRGVPEGYEERPDDYNFEGE